MAVQLNEVIKVESAVYDADLSSAGVTGYADASLFFRGMGFVQLGASDTVTLEVLEANDNVGTGATVVKTLEVTGTSATIGFRNDNLSKRYVAIRATSTGATAGTVGLIGGDYTQNPVA